MAEWVRLALTDWVADLPQVRLTTPEVGENALSTVLPDTAAEDLRSLARDPSPRRLNLWLALLAEAQWPVAAAAPVLGVTGAAISSRVAAGQKLLEGAEDLDLLFSLIPAVPEAPVSTYKMLPGEELIGVSVRIATDLLDLVTEKASLERVSMSYAVRTALSDRFAGLGLEADGEPSPFV